RADPAELRGVGPLHPLTVGGTLGPVRFAATGDQAVFTIKRIDHLVLRVADLQAMLRFYRDVLGFPLEMVQEDIGLYQLRAGESLIDLVPVDGKLGRAGGPAPGPTGRNLEHLCLAVEPFDGEAITAYLRGQGCD